MSVSMRCPQSSNPSSLSSIPWYDPRQTRREDKEHFSCVSWHCWGQNQLIPQSFVRHHCPNPHPWFREACILRVLVPVPRKSQDVVMTLPSLHLGSRHFDAKETLPLTDGDLTHPYHPLRMTDGGVGSPIPSSTDDGWGVSLNPSVSVIRRRIGPLCSFLSSDSAT